MRTGRTEDWELSGGGQHHRVALDRRDSDSSEQRCSASPCPLDGELQPAPPCLSFPHRSTLHGGAWLRGDRAAPTNTRYPAEPWPAVGTAAASPWQELQDSRRGRVWGQADQGYRDTIISLLGRRVWGLLGTAELLLVVVAQR
ncbi:hypothetical protein Nmel_013846 [Mimus melanotis]